MVSEVWVCVGRGHFWGDGEFDGYVLGLTGLQEGTLGRKGRKRNVYYDVMMSFLFVVYYLIGYLHKVGTCLGGGCIHLY